MKFCNLASGSRGNCSVLEAGSTCILVDCGLPIFDVENKLKLRGFDSDRVKAIFLTHEHRDHVSGVVAFCKKYGALLFLHAKVFYRFAFMFEKIRDQIRVFDFSDFYFEDFTVSPFELSHDAACPTGFAFYHMGKKICFVTDTGFIPQNSLQAMEQSDIIFLEANHDSQMLINGPYTAKLKRRIASEEGHLSNKQAGEYAAVLAKSGTRRFVLAHLSEKNNLPLLAEKTVREALEAAGFLCDVSLASQSEPSKVYLL